MTIEQEIRDTFQRLGTDLASPEIFGSPFWTSNSQYGVTLTRGYNTKGEAEAATIAYYTARMELIRQCDNRKKSRTRSQKRRVNYRKDERRDLARAVRREARQYNTCIHNVSMVDVCLDCFEESNGTRRIVV